MGNSLRSVKSPDYIQGGVDGLVTTFSIINGAISAGVKLKTVIILGIVNILGDGFSIACAKYLSAKAEEDLSKKTDPNYKRSPSPMSSAITVFVSFALSGLVPLIPLVVKYYFHGNVVSKGGILSTFSDVYFITMYAFTLLTLFGLGYIRGKVDNFDPQKSGLEVLAIGTGAAMIAAIVGSVLRG